MEDSMVVCVACLLSFLAGMCIKDMIKNQCNDYRYDEDDLYEGSGEQSDEFPKWLIWVGVIKLFNDLQVKLFAKPGIKLTGYSPNQINNNYAIISDTSMIKEL